MDDKEARRLGGLLDRPQNQDGYSYDLDAVARPQVAERRQEAMRALDRARSLPDEARSRLERRVFRDEVGWDSRYIAAVSDPDYLRAFPQLLGAAMGSVLADLGMSADEKRAVALLLRIFWRWFKVMWGKAKQGAAILGDVRAYVKWVLLPQMGGYAAKVGVIVVFLAAYGIPVTFGSVMSVLGSSQLANILSFTPGGVGVNQAFNTFALDSYTDPTTAIAYSLGHQLITTAFNTAFAIVLICIVFGWSGRLGAGQVLVRGRQGEGGRHEGRTPEKRVEKIEERRREREHKGRRGLLRVFRRSSERRRERAAGLLRRPDVRP